MATLLTTSEITEITADLARYVLIRDALDATILVVSGRTLKEYRLDTGEGAQRGELQEIQHLMTQFSFLESRIRSLRDELAGRGVTNTVLRRYPGAARRI